MEKIKLSDNYYNLYILLAQTRMALQKLRQKELAIYKISSHQAHALFIIQLIETLGGKATPAEIARWYFREPHSVSQLLKRMKNQGLVRKIRDSEKKNQILIVITDKGKEAFQKSMNRESIHKMMSKLSKEQQQQLRSLLEPLRDAALKELGMEGKIYFLRTSTSI
jgi:DNA-binding MarR family transcriptional regulator